MEGVEEASSGLQAAAEAWLASLPAAAVESPPDGGPLLLDVPLLELAASQAHDEFFAALLACPGAPEAGWGACEAQVQLMAAWEAQQAACGLQ